MSSVAQEAVDVRRTSAVRDSLAASDLERLREAREPGDTQMLLAPEPSAEHVGRQGGGRVRRVRMPATALARPKLAARPGEDLLTQRHYLRLRETREQTVREPPVARVSTRFPSRARHRRAARGHR